MQLLRRLSLVDFVLIVALVVVGALAILNQRSTGATTTTDGGIVLTTQDVNAFGDALEALFTALAAGQDTDAAFTGLADVVEGAGDTALAPQITELGAAYAMRNDLGIASALRAINGLTGTTPLAEYVLSTYASGTLAYAIDAGPATPATGREWVHLVWVETGANDAFVGWRIAPGEATWTVEPGNTAVNLDFAVPGEGYRGTLRLAPASPGALVEAAGTFSAPLARTEIALGEPISPSDGILIRDAGEGATARPDQPWRGETRLGEPPDLLDNVRRAEAIAWTAVMPDGRTFLMRIRIGETGRAAISAVFAE